MGIFTTSKKPATFDWNSLTEDKQLDDLIQLSYQKPVLLFKHSTRCSISNMAKNRLESEWDVAADRVEMVYLDLLNHRELSNKIAEVTNVIHQSPQAILLRNGAVVYHSSHEAISALAIKKMIE